MRATILVTSLLLLGCASARTNELVHSAFDTRLDAPLLATDTAGTTAAASVERVEPEAVSTAPDPSTLYMAPQEGESLHTNRFTLKAGYYGSSEDALDDGYIIGLAWTRFLSRIFALEFETGYLDADGDDAGVDTEVWGVPLMVNGRVNLPVWILELYGGLGVGGFYYDAEASGAVTASDDGFLWGGNAFLGASINLADRIALGLEGKYYVTEDISDVDAGLDAFALMLTLGFSQ